LKKSFALNFSLREAVSDERSEHVLLDLLVWTESFCNYSLSNPNARSTR
jgi:hypothetical protein